MAAPSYLTTPHGSGSTGAGSFFTQLASGLEQQITRNAMMAHQEMQSHVQAAQAMIATGDPEMMKAGFAILMEPHKQNFLGKLKGSEAYQKAAPVIDKWMGKSNYDMIGGPFNASGAQQPATDKSPGSVLPKMQPPNHPFDWAQSPYEQPTGHSLGGGIAGMGGQPPPQLPQKPDAMPGVPAMTGPYGGAQGQVP